MWDLMTGNQDYFVNMIKKSQSLVPLELTIS